MYVLEQKVDGEWMMEETFSTALKAFIARDESMKDTGTDDTIWNVRKLTDKEIARATELADFRKMLGE